MTTPEYTLTKLPEGTIAAISPYRSPIVIENFAAAALAMLNGEETGMTLAEIVAANEALTAKQKQIRANKQAQRERDRRAGLVRLELRVTEEQRDKLVAYMQKLVDEDS